MSLRGFKKTKTSTKLTLVPIMDAVFIFIFFLLMSAQFIEIYEVGTDAPSVKTLSKDEKIEDPLALTLRISKLSIVVTTGLDENVVTTLQKKGTKFDLEELNKLLVKIKLENIEESSVILKPSSDVPYHEIVSIIDATREPFDKKELSGKNKKGVISNSKKLFDQIIFETII